MTNMKISTTSRVGMGNKAVRTQPPVLKTGDPWAGGVAHRTTRSSSIQPPIHPSTPFLPPSLHPSITGGVQRGGLQGGLRAAMAGARGTCAARGPARAWIVRPGAAGRDGTRRMGQGGVGAARGLGRPADHWEWIT